jgi:hypothetical protein
MRHLVLTIIAICIAGIAAIAATTAMLNAPMRIGPAANNTGTPAQTGQAPAPASKDTPDAPPAKDAAPQPASPAGTPPAAGSADGKAPAAGDTPEDPDKDPYEGIAPEDLPPDLQYDADASVSFPTNT